MHKIAIALEFLLYRGQITVSNYRIIVISYETQNRYHVLQHLCFLEGPARVVYDKKGW